jgi:pimeloyl-ACP methyl ester carboxylesterase
MTRVDDSMNAATVALDGRRIEVLDLPGDPARAPVVLLHEGLGSVRLWRSFPHELAAATGARLVAFSRFGHGASDPPPDHRTPRFMHDEALDVLPRLLDALGAREPVLAGHSDGASIALIHAAAHPVRGVVAIAPHVFVEPVGLAEIRRARDAYLHGGLRERMARHHRDPDAAFFGWNDVWLDPEFPAWSIEEELERIAAPLLLIQGDEDQYGTMAQLDAIERAVRVPVERVHLRCAHAPHLEAPAETLAAVARFVARVG